MGCSLSKFNKEMTGGDKKKKNARIVDRLGSKRKKHQKENQRKLIWKI